MILKGSKEPLKITFLSPFTKRLGNLCESKVTYSSQLISLPFYNCAIQKFEMTTRQPSRYSRTINRSLFRTIYAQKGVCDSKKLCKFGVMQDFRCLAGCSLHIKSRSLVLRTRRWKWHCETNHTFPNHKLTCCLFLRERWFTDCNLYSSSRISRLHESHETDS